MLNQILIAVTMVNIAAGINCPKKINMENFSVSKYMGTWYEGYSFGANYYNDDNKCPKEVFTQQPDNITIVDSSERLKQPGQNMWPGYVTLAEPGQLVIHQDFGNNDIVTYTLNILGTDYDNWAVVWSCPAFNNRQNSWVMTRKRLNYYQELSANHRAQITKILTKENLKWSDYSKSPNYNCTN